MNFYHLRWHEGFFKYDYVAFSWAIVAIDVSNVKEDFFRAISGSDFTVAFVAAEVVDDSLKGWRGSDTVSSFVNKRKANIK